jgi:integrase/recombinase XerD
MNVVSEIIEEITSVCLQVNQNELEKILLRYDINKKITNYDLQEKIKLFLSIKEIEGISKNTVKNYTYQLNMFFDKINKSIGDIDTDDIRSYLSIFSKQKQTTVNTKFTIIKNFFDWLKEEEYILKNPALKIKIKKPKILLPKCLTIEELIILKESCRTLKERALIETFYATGCRLSELVSLNVNNINYSNMQTIITGKGNKERNIYFNETSLIYLKKYIKTRNDNCSALFVTERKPYRRMQNRLIQRLVENIAKRSGIQKKITCHVLRHTFASSMLNNGADITVIQSLLGHASPNTTQIYAQVTNDRKQEQYKRYILQ